MFGARFIVQRKPGLGDIADALQLPLHFGVLGFQSFRGCVGRNINWRRKQNHRSRKGSRHQKMVPRLLKRLPAFHSNVKNHDRASRFPRQHHRTRLGHIPRPARPINRECAIEAFFQSPRHHRQPAQSPARGAALRRSESQPLDHFACPLPVERRGVHHHHAVVSIPPHNRDYDPVPEGPDTLLLCRIHTLGMLPAQHFVAQRRTQHSNHAVRCRGDNRNLDAPRPRQLGQPYVVVHIHGFLAGFLCGLDGCVGCRHHPLRAAASPPNV